MSLIKWSPFGFPSAFEEFDKLFHDFPAAQSMGKGFVPALDVYETKDAVVVETPLAGVDPKDVEVTVENGVLTLKGETKKEHEVEEKNYYRKEVRAGSFYRQVALPAHVLGEKADASFENGMLKVTVPKAPEAKGKTVKVTVKRVSK